MIPSIIIVNIGYIGHSANIGPDIDDIIRMYRVPQKPILVIYIRISQYLKSWLIEKELMC